MMLIYIESINKIIIMCGILKLMLGTNFNELLLEKFILGQ